MKHMVRGFGWVFGITCLLGAMGCIFTTTTPAPLCHHDSDCTAGNICTRDGRCISNTAPVSCNGDLRIVWTFDGMQGCPDDVEDMIIKVFTPSGAPLHKNPQGDPIACAEGSQTFHSLDCGTYQIQVQAVDANDAITWSAPQAPMEVVDNRVAEATANLQQE